MSNEHNRFWSKVSRSDECWLWQAHKNTRGYGVFSAKGRRLELAHRAAWRLSGRGLKPTDLLCHRCDNPSCVRPDHLFIGTNADNVADQIAKGRHPTYPGGKNGRVKLALERVADIRRRYKPGSTRIVDLAAEFGISKSQVWNIVSGREWNEMPTERMSK